VLTAQKLNFAHICPRLCIFGRKFTDKAKIFGQPKILEGQQPIAVSLGMMPLSCICCWTVCACFAFRVAVSECSFGECISESGVIFLC